MLSVHRLLGTWERKISVYITLTDLARRLFIESGLAAEKLVVKPNFVDPDPGIGTGSGGYALFVGDSPLRRASAPCFTHGGRSGQRLPLLVVGEGPLGPDVAAAAGETPGVTWLGKRAPNEVAPLLREATCLVFPSECYETFGRVIVEAFATGTPVVAAGHGAAAELIADGSTGLHFRPGDAADLAAKVIHLNSHPPCAG
jgi:glycosyltransferase involved in cell wall biosynthesis